MSRKRLAAAALCAALLLGAAVPAARAADSWYAAAADYCLENNLMDELDGGFAPGAAMTRAMLVSALYRAAGSPGPEEPRSFPDVPEDAWYADAVGWAAGRGIVTGRENGLFSGDDPVTRQEAAALLWRCAGSPAAQPADSFVDGARIADYARTAVDWARSAGIVNGFPDGRFGPEEPATRAQAAEMLMRYRQAVTAGPDVLYVSSGAYEPCGIAAGEDGALLIGDVFNKVIWRVDGGGSAVYAGGQSAPDIYGRPAGGYYDGDMADSLFRSPWAIAPFLDGWAVTDAENGAIRFLSGGKVQTLNCTTREYGIPKTGSTVRFTYPTGLAAGEDGCLYVSDTHENAIRKITPEGEVTTYARGLSDPTGLCWKDGALYVADTGSNRILRLEDGKVAAAIGSGEDGLLDGGVEEAAFSVPQGVAVDDDGAVYVADTGNSAVRRVRDGVVDTIYARDPADMDALCPISPIGLLIAEGRLYVCDSFAQKILILPLGE